MIVKKTSEISWGLVVECLEGQEKDLELDAV